ncbi:flavodoxin family protein [Enterococcus diestrammenae]|uniref:NAD(P)H dehydrogenase (Quinone) n=1 Tax=Enterococcus diestrammenae TaxID=1155073 RepID=A0ABV0F2F0_9ENTE|nr:NAD(P)H-dependent oxidoreductase [Enterococcus diestrammenae]KAF1295005.1 hypothetical protein BAU18_04750 [Enterococcus diestrammenae]
MKITVLYYTKIGHTKEMAEIVAAGARQVAGVEAAVFPMEAPDVQWLTASDCVLLGTPTYMADLAGVVKCWLETAGHKYPLAGKLGGAFATAHFSHGGGDIAIQSILHHLLVAGMVVYSGGDSLGQPVIHLGPVALSEDLEQYQSLFATYGQRMAEKAVALFGES